MATQVILLERVDNLGDMGDVVSVKPGYARNFLLPQKKALRASQENIAYFESKKKFLEAENEKTKKAAEKLAKDMKGLTVTLVRQAAQAGQLFGSVNSRDIAEQVAAASGATVTRSMVKINQSFKSIGLFPVEVALHPEVSVTVTVNIARSTEEAEIQAKTGKALIADDSQTAATAQADESLEDVLEESAIEAKKEQQEEEAEEAEEAKARAEKSAARATKKATKKAKAPKEDEAEEASEDESSDDE